VGNTALDLTACATGEGVVAVADNLAAALVISEAATPYLTVVTTNAAERVKLGKPLAVTAGMTAFADLTAAATGEALVNVADTRTPSPSSRTTAPRPATNAQTDHVKCPLKFAAGLAQFLDLTAVATGEAIANLKDNLAIALEIKEGANSIFTVCTTNSAELITWGYAHAYSATAKAIADPGTGLAIPVTRDGVCNLTSAGAGETRTVAIPTYIGQRLTLHHDTDGGAIAITFASAINQAGNTIGTFTEVDDFLELVGVTKGGTRCWRIVANDGVALS
jgi:hypothetical protein